MSFGRSTSFSFGGQPSTSTGFGAPAGQGNAAAAATPSFSFGGASTNAQPQQQQAQASSSSFSFGAPKPQQPAGAGLFGAAPSGAQPSTGLFGSTSNQPAGGGLFGQRPAATAGQTSGTAFGSSLFGGGGGGGQQPAQAGGGLFGGGQTNAAPASSTFGFGQTQPTQQQQQQAQPAAGFSFGATAPAGQAQRPGLFGATAPTQSQPAFGSSTLGQSSLQPASNVGLSINPASPFARQAYHQKERFNDLPEDQKKLFEELDKHISGQLRLKDELASKEYGKDLKKRASEWNDLQNNVNNTLLILQQDQDLIKNIVDSVERDRTDLATLYDIARNFKDGKSDGKQWATWPGDFFAKAAAEFRHRIRRYRSTIEEIERQLATIDTHNEHSPQLISDAIVHQNAIFMALASNVAGLHAELDQLKREFVQWYQQQYRSVRDPFAMSQLTSTL